MARCPRMHVWRWRTTAHGQSGAHERSGLARLGTFGGRPPSGEAKCLGFGGPSTNKNPQLLAELPDAGIGPRDGAGFILETLPQRGQLRGRDAVFAGQLEDEREPVLDRCQRRRVRLDAVAEMQQFAPRFLQLYGCGGQQLSQALGGGTERLQGGTHRTRLAQQREQPVALVSLAERE